MMIIGLTGGIGSGKSTVSTLFEKHGIPTIDADIISREITAPGQPALKEIAQIFDPHTLNSKGELNRAHLRQIIFEQADKKQALEAILHPAILSEMLKQTKELTAPYCLFAIPLLFETGQDQYVDRVLVIDAEESIRRQRIQKRNALSSNEINAIINAQISQKERLSKADDIITNNGDLNGLVSQINIIHQHYNRLLKFKDIRNNT